MTDLNSDNNWSEIEIYKLEFEYLKHLTTISSASILLLVAFLEKLFTNQPEWKMAIAVSLCSFLCSIILCAFSQATIIEKASERKNIKWRDKIQNWTVGLLLASLACYVIGVISLVAFGLKNLFLIAP